MKTVGPGLPDGADLHPDFDGQRAPTELRYHFGTAGPDGDVCVIGSAGGDPCFRVTPASSAGQALSEAEGSG